MAEPTSQSPRFRKPAASRTHNRESRNAAGGTSPVCRDLHEHYRSLGVESDGRKRKARP